jgi:hypothetical protein
MKKYTNLLKEITDNDAFSEMVLKVIDSEVYIVKYKRYNLKENKLIEIYDSGGENEDRSL